MANFSWEAVVSVYGIAVLIAKMYAVVFLTGYARAKSQTPSTPEDRGETRGEAQSLFASVDKSGVDRALALHRNDLENIAVFLLALFSLILCASTKLPSWIMPVYIAVFVASRLAHTVCMTLALQPWRAIAFIVGSLAVMIAQGVACVYVFL